MTTIEIIHCVDETELYRHYQGEAAPQGAYIALDIVTGKMHATHESLDSETSEAYHGIERRYPIPILTGTAVNRVMEEIAPLAQRILDDSDMECHRSRWRGVLGEDGLAAEAEIEALTTYGAPYEPLWPVEDLVAIHSLDHVVDGDEVDYYGITADTTDERLGQIEAEILRSLASPSGVAVVQEPMGGAHLCNYLREQRDALQPA